MTTNDRANQILLSDALYELALTEGPPKATVLDEVTRRYPQHAAELTAFAVALALESDSDDDDSSASATSTASPAVTRAMSRFHNKLYEVRSTSTRTPIPTENPFSKLDRGTLRSLGIELGLNTLLITRLRDRRIRPETIPDAFTRRMSEAMKVPLGAITAHLTAGPEIHRAMQHKSDRKPEAVAQQTFEEAALASGLTEVQVKKLLGA